MMDQKKEINGILEDIQKSQESSSLSWSGTLLSEPLTLDNKLAQLCLKLPKVEFNELGIDDVHILWLRNENGNDSINGRNIKMFSTNDTLVNCISEIETKNIFLLIDQDFASNILSFLDDFSQIVFIYILTNDDMLFIDCKRSIRKISNDKIKLFRLIEEDIDLCTKDYLSTSIFDLHTEEESTNQTQNLSFLWYHLLINSLFDLPTCHQTSKADFVKYCREQYVNNTFQQNVITEFENDYSPANAIRWFTRGSFLYCLLNKALRTREIDVIFKFRFFIIDFQNQLEKHYNEELMDCLQFAYRGQQMSAGELNKLKNSEQKYISINTYLSATTDRDVAKNFAADPSSVILVIQTENAIHLKNSRARPVCVQDQSSYPEEYEVIFPIGSTFLVESIEMKNDQWHLNLILSDDDNYEQLIAFFQDKYIMRLPSTVQFADLLVSKGEYEKAERYLQILIEDLQLSNDPINQGYAYDYMGQLWYKRNDYHSALSWFEKALECLPKENIYCGRIYTHIGSLYYQNNDYNHALEYYTKALRYDQEIDWFDAAELYDNFGKTFTQMNRFEDALGYLNRALDIRQSNQLSYHGYLSTYISLASLYIAKAEPKEALRLLKEILHILLNTAPKTHPYFVLIYSFLGYLSFKCEDDISAMIYCQRALQLKEMIWKNEIINPVCYIFLCDTLIELYRDSNDIINMLYYTQEAYNTYDKFVHSIPQTSPIVPILHINIGSAYYRLQNLSSALDCFLKVLELIDDNNNRLTACLNLAMIFIDKSDVTMARNYLDQSFVLISDAEVKNSITAQWNYEYSRVYYLENNLEKSFFCAEEALRLSANQDYHLIFNNCILLSKLCPDKERGYIENLLSVVQDSDPPENIKRLYHYYIGLYFKRQKNFSQALEQFQLSLKSQLTTNPPCYYDLILTYSYISEIYLQTEPKELCKILYYSEKCLRIYSQLSNMREIPIKDLDRMFYAEEYLLDNIKQSSLLTGTLFLLCYAIADYFVSRGNNRKALNYIEQAGELVEQYQGNEEKLNREFRYYVLASAYKSIQFYNQAIFYYKKSLGHISSDYNRYGQRYESLGQVYREKKDYLMSLSTYKIALTFLHNAHSINYEYLAYTYASVASLYAAINKYEYAFIYCQQTVEYFRLCDPVNYDFLVSMYNLGAMSCWKSKPWLSKQALEYILQALEFSQYVLTDYMLRDLYSTLGFMFMLNEMYDKALLYYNKSLEYSVSSDDFSGNYEKIWLVCMLMGDWDQAFEIVKKSIANQFAMKILNVNQISGSYINMGSTYYRFGKYQLAFECYHAAFDFLQAFQNDPTHGKYGEIYNFIGLIYFKYGNFSNALKYCLKARDILSLTKNQDLTPIYPYISLGMIECKLENYHNSLDCFARAWELIYNNNRYYYNLAYKTLYNHIGFVYYKLNQTELAMQFYLKSLSLYNKYDQHRDLAQVHKNIGLIYEIHPENYSLALASYKRALQLVPTNEHPDLILYRSLIITMKKKWKKERKRKRKLRSKRTCQLL